jgi:hypothetical protein
MSRTVTSDVYITIFKHSVGVFGPDHVTTFFCLGLSGSMKPKLMAKATNRDR